MLTRLALTFLLLASSSISALANEVVTSFEFDDASGSFSLGTGSGEVTFNGGVAGVLFVSPLYHSGTHSWMISPAQTGEITFAVNQGSVDLWIRDQAPGGNGRLTVFDASGSIITQVTANDTVFQHIVAGSVAQPVDRITLENTGGSGVSVIDDFMSCTARPGTPYCFCSAGLGPCGVDDPGAGCPGAGGSGALLEALGGTSVSNDTLTFRGTSFALHQPLLLFSGANVVNGGAGLTFGNGLRCAGGAVARHGVFYSDFQGDAVLPTGFVAGGFSAGQTRRFQAWYRDPLNTVCGSFFNLSNGVEVQFTP